MKHYLLWIEGDVEPTVLGPFKDEEQRDKRAFDSRRLVNDGKGSLFMATVDPTGRLSVDPYSSAFFSETCEHSTNEDCMNCSECGDCSESLCADHELCSECRTKKGSPCFLPRCEGGE